MPNTDHTSPAISLLLLTRYYTPSLRRHTAITIIATLLCCLLSQLIMHSTYLPSLILYSLTGTITMFIYYCGPLLFATARTRTLTAQLPVTPAVRLTFLLTYTFLYIPAIMLITWYATIALITLTGITPAIPQQWLMHMLRARGIPATDLHLLSDLSSCSIYTYIQNTLPAIVCLNISIRARSHPILLAIAGIFATLILTGFIGGIAGFIKGITDGLHGTPSTQLTTGMLHFITLLQYIIGILSLLTLLLGSYLLYRHLRTRNI